MVRRLCQIFLAMVFVGLSAADVKAQKLSSAYGALGGTFLPMWVTQDAGLFKKYGLDVDLVFVTGGSIAVTALASGQTSIVGAGASMVPLAGSGADIVFIADMVDMPYFLVARSEIKSKDDLRGKRVGISRFGSSSDFATRTALQEMGLVPDKDVAILQIGAVPDRFAAMDANIVQATVLTPPINLVAKKRGFSILLNVASLGLKIPDSGLVATRSYIHSSREIVRRYLMAYLEGIKVMKSNPALSMKSLSRYTRVTDTQSLEEAYKFYAGAVLERPYVDIPSVQKVIDFYKKSRPAMEKLKAEQIVDMGILSEIDKSGFIDALYKN